MIRPLHQILTGPHAFFNQSYYPERTKTEFESHSTVQQTSYVYQTHHKVTRLALEVLSWIIFPIGLYRLFHRVAGIVIIQASNYTCLPKWMNLHSYPQANRPVYCRHKVNLQDEWKYKRLKFDVDGYAIDAMIIGKATTLGNGRWVLGSRGNGEFFEEQLLPQWSEIKPLLTEIKGNALLFNYPGVGHSSGFPSRSGMVKAYQAMLNALEDQKNGMAAREIIPYGHSIGAAIQAEALSHHSFKKGIKYVVVKSRTFDELVKIVFKFYGLLAGLTVQLLNWNIKLVNASKNLKVPEIILQTANVLTAANINNKPHLIHSDGVISADTALAKTLMDDPTCSKQNKYFIGIPETHNENIKSLTELGGLINDLLRRPS